MSACEESIEDKLERESSADEKCALLPSLRGAGDEGVGPGEPPDRTGGRKMTLGLLLDIDRRESTGLRMNPVGSS